MTRGAALALVVAAAAGCDQVVFIGLRLGDAGAVTDGGMTDGEGAVVVAPARGGSARPQLVLDGFGGEHVVYADATEPALWYARRPLGGTLTRARLARFPAGTQVTPVASPSFDAAGDLHVLYVAGRAFHLAQRPAGWSTPEPVPGVDVTGELRFAVEPNGDLAVAEWTPGRLRVHRGLGGAWSTAVVETWAAAGGTGTLGLAAAGTNQLVVLARRSNGDALRAYALLPSGDWSSHATPALALLSSTFAVEPSGAVHFAGARTSAQAGYFTGSGASWASEPLDLDASSLLSLRRDSAGGVTVAGITFVTMPLPVRFTVKLLDRAAAGWTTSTRSYRARDTVSVFGGVPAWQPAVVAVDGDGEPVLLHTIAPVGTPGAAIGHELVRYASGVQGAIDLDAKERLGFWTAAAGPSGPRVLWTHGSQLLDTAGPRIARRTPAGWTNEALGNEPPGLQFCSRFLIAPDDRELVVGFFGLPDNSEGFVARAPGEAWSSPRSLGVAQGAPPLYVAVDRAGAVHSLYRNSSGELRLSHAGSTSADEVVAAQVPADVRVTMAFDSANRPHVRVADSLGSAAGGTWTLVPVPNLPATASRMFIDASDRPCVAFASGGMARAACLAAGAIVTSELAAVPAESDAVTDAVFSGGAMHLLLSIDSGAEPPWWYVGPGGLRALGHATNVQLAVHGAMVTFVAEDRASGRLIELTK